MRSVNAMALRAMGITLGVLILITGVWWGGSTAWKKYLGGDGDRAVTSQGDVAGEERKDTDGDGLPDVYEPLYQTDPNNPDTDGDGKTDLEEINSGTDPANSGEDDEVKPLTGELVTDTSTFTGQYLASLPVDVPREEILRQDRLEAFVNLNTGELLPALPEGTIKTNERSGKAVIETYLDSVSTGTNPNLTAVTNERIEAAMQKELVSVGDVSLDEILAELERNVDVITAVEAPAEVAELHTQYVQASMALRDNVQLLNGMADGDFVGGLIGAKNIEGLAPIFLDIAEKVKALEEKYNIE